MKFFVSWWEMPGKEDTGHERRPTCWLEPSFPDDIKIHGKWCSAYAVDGRRAICAEAEAPDRAAIALALREFEIRFNEERPVDWKIQPRPAGILAGVAKS